MRSHVLPGGHTVDRTSSYGAGTQIIMSFAIHLARDARVVLGLMALLSLPQRVAWAQSVPVQAVRVGLYDYAGVPSDEMARAERDATRWFADMGIETRWIDMSQCPSGLSDSLRPACADRPELVLIIPNRQMVTRLTSSPDVVGLAPGTKTERGRIAYVFYDRVRAVPRATEVDLLALVIGHELGHLLLPHGSHSTLGVMRGDWDLQSVRRLNVRRLTFTPVQAREIRRRVLGSSTTPISFGPTPR